ncbi:unnamed protein product [Amoebophrya sp. A120]|nr:unnamed protein product [Amoebophrya sp. A120]|eukprot:GSA120T00018069001.1
MSSLVVSSTPHCLWILNRNGTLIFHRDFKPTCFTANDRIRLASTLHGISAVAARITPAPSGVGNGAAERTNRHEKGSSVAGATDRTTGDFSGAPAAAASSITPAPSYTGCLPFESKTTSRTGGSSSSSGAIRRSSSPVAVQRPEFMVGASRFPGNKNAVAEQHAAVSSVASSTVPAAASRRTRSTSKHVFHAPWGTAARNKARGGQDNNVDISAQDQESLLEGGDQWFEIPSSAALLNHASTSLVGEVPALPALAGRLVRQMANGTTLPITQYEQAPQVAAVYHRIVNASGHNEEVSSSSVSSPGVASSNKNPINGNATGGDVAFSSGSTTFVSSASSSAAPSTTGRAVTSPQQLSSFATTAEASDFELASTEDEFLYWQVPEKVLTENLVAYRREQYTDHRKACTLRACQNSALHPRGITRVEAAGFQVFMLQTRTNLRFILITEGFFDSKKADLFLKYVYERFAVLILQDPFVVSLDLPVQSAAFDQALGFGLQLAAQTENE